MVLSQFFLGCELFFASEDIAFAQLDEIEEYEEAINGINGLLASAMDNNYAYYASVKGDDLSWQTGNRQSNYVPSNPNYSFNIYNDETKTCLQLDDIHLEDEFITGYTWTNYYKIITSLNNLITQYSNNDNDNDNEIIQIAGEAYLIRAYCYLRLTRIYGEIPLIEDVQVDYTVSKSTFTEIYEFIEHDLLMALQLLPEDNSTARISMVTPHKGTALSILAELYLCWAGYPVKDGSKYELAALTAEKVIDNMDAYGMGLLDDFAELWKKENLYNKESVLSIYFPLPAIQSKFGIGYLFRGEYKEPLLLRYDGLSYFASEYRFYNNFPKNYRRDVTFFNTVLYTTYEIIDSSSYLIDTVSIYIDQALPCRKIGYRKFYYDLTFDKYVQNDRTITAIFGSQRLDLFRFAHTLLTYAEAAARSGHLNAKAYECVNMIRRRANNIDLNTPSYFDLQPGLSTKAFADSVVWERAWELAGEPEGRWFDLVRLEMVEDLPQLREIDDGDFPADMIVTKDDYYFPIPVGEIILNPSLGE
ncbi:MAG: RagB/SusD family nutrient uptake outer membrane protein [Marinilabiliaceae bacterium]|nr:RagB/SusD family nutrient uptake outer membrane protein [Marinilabiliaceae bacterium]